VANYPQKTIFDEKCVANIKIMYQGKEHRVPSGSNGFQLAQLLASSDTKIIALIIDGINYDLSKVLTTNATVSFITTRDEEGVKVLRHSAAHLMAYALLELYGDNIKFAIGPVIENGFYYDFDLDTNLSENDLEKITIKMQELVKKNESFLRQEWSVVQAESFFREKNQPYKLELLKDIPSKEIISIYQIGKYTDLCRGIHLPSVGYIQHFKLLKISGAYWRGNSRNKMLQRIYGTCWDTIEELQQHLKFLKEATERDHKKICQDMDMLHFEHEFAPGAPFYHSNGLVVFHTLIDYMRSQQDKNGYREISTPRVMNRALWEISGHWDHYGKHNFSCATEDGGQFCVKPMNCPGSILVYKQSIRSYRELPLRISEFGQVNRYETSGSLNGLLRVREFTQDDAHIYCTPEQLEQECVDVVRFILNVYKDFGFQNSVRVKLSTRPLQRIGSDEIWDKSEKSLSDVLLQLSIPYTLFPGEGAFYGPKLEFVLQDVLGRDWQAGTLQVDMNLPNRFAIKYVDRRGEKQEPIMLHRAVLGSFERFFGILTEHFAGKFPLWLHPLQVGVVTITDDNHSYAVKIAEKYRQMGLRVIMDFSSEKIGYKIRNMSLKKVPYILTIGKKEEIQQTVSVRILGYESTKTLDISPELLGQLLLEKIQQKDLDYRLMV
jgi:threonyl-tRNA synthetase